MDRIHKAGDREVMVPEPPATIRVLGEGSMLLAQLTQQELEDVAAAWREELFLRAGRQASRMPQVRLSSLQLRCLQHLADHGTCGVPLTIIGRKGWTPSLKALIARGFAEEVPGKDSVGRPVDDQLWTLAKPTAAGLERLAAVIENAG